MCVRRLSRQLRKGPRMPDAFPPGETIDVAATFTEDAVSRRRFLQLLGGGAGAVAVSGAVAACGQDTGSSSGDAERSPAASTTTPASLVRLSSVVTPKEGGLYDDLLPDFERQTGYQVELTTGEEVYGPARNGEADVVISHYGHRDAQSCVQDGYGQWPQPVLFNQLALLGPPSDPAQVQDLSDLVEAFRRIAATQSPYIVNDLKLNRYLTEILWEGAGRPQQGQWYRDQGLKE